MAELAPISLRTEVAADSDAASDPGTAPAAAAEETEFGGFEGIRSPKPTPTVAATLRRNTSAVSSASLPMVVRPTVRRASSVDATTIADAPAEIAEMFSSDAPRDPDDLGHLPDSYVDVDLAAEDELAERAQADADAAQGRASNRNRRSKRSRKYPHPAQRGSKNRRSIRRALQTSLQSVAGARAFGILLRRSASEDELYERITGIWTLVAIVATFLAAIAHVGFVQAPDWSSRNDEGADWWLDAYAISFLVSLVGNLAAVFSSAFLLVFLVFVPKGSVRFALRKLLYVLIVPTYFALVGFLALMVGLLALARITYSDIPALLWWALAGLGIAVVGFTGGIVFTVAKSGKVLDAQRERKSSSTSNPTLRSPCVVRAVASVVGLFTFPSGWRRMINSGLDNDTVRSRVVRLWSLLSVVASIMGTASFEAYWLRPVRHTLLPNPNNVTAVETAIIQEATPFTARAVHSFCMYSAIVYNMYVVLLAVGLLVFQFFTDEENVAELLTRSAWAIAAPAVSLLVATLWFMVGAPFIVEAVYGRGTVAWFTASGVFGLCTVATLVLCGLIVRHFRHSGRVVQLPTLNPTAAAAAVVATDDTTAAAATGATGVSDGFGAKDTMGRRIGFAVNTIDFYQYYVRVLRSLRDEEEVRERVERNWSSTAIVGALLSVISFLAVQVFGEYRPRDASKLGIYSTAAILALVANLSSMVTGVSLLFVLSTLPKGRLGPWVARHVHFVFLPAVLQAGGVFSLLVALSALGHHIYDDIVFHTGVGVAIAVLMLMVAVRRRTTDAIPLEAGLDATQAAIVRITETRIRLTSRRSLLSYITRSDLFLLLLHTAEEPEIFRRIAAMLHELGLVSALLSLISMDSFRERPLGADGRRVHSDIYGIASLLGLTFCLLALFLSTFFGFMISLVPAGSVKSFIHDMRDLLYLPALSLVAGVTSLLVSWSSLVSLQYEDVPYAVWTARGFCIATFVLLNGLGVFMGSITKRVFHLRDESQVDRRRQTVWHVATEENPCSCSGVVGYFYDMVVGWQRSLTHSNMTGHDLYARMQGLWTHLGQIGALLATMSFLALQQGFPFTNDPESASRQSFAIIAIVLSLCFAVSAAYLATFYHFIMLFIPPTQIVSFLKGLSPVLMLPNLFLFLACVLFLATVPIFGRALYSERVAVVAEYLGWGLAAFTMAVTLGMQLFRAKLQAALSRRAEPEADDDEVEG